MATRIAWWLNLDSALELEEPRGYVQANVMAERVRELASRMRTLITSDDVLLEASSARVEPAAEVSLAFCPAPSALEALRRHGYTPAKAPSFDVLRVVTRRAFASQLAQHLPGAAYVTTLEQLQAHVRKASFTGEWLLKRDFAFAGRERRRVRADGLDMSTLGFARRSFARWQGLQVEPYVQRLGDFAQHGYLRESGELLVGPIMEQQCDARGVWQASRKADADALNQAERETLLENVRRAATALGGAGYFGPFGVDAFRYVGPTGAAAFQPLCEVNARFSMGYPRELLEQALSG